MAELILAVKELSDTERLDAIPLYGLHLMEDQERVNSLWVKIWRVTILTSKGAHVICASEMRQAIDRAVALYHLHLGGESYDRSNLN